MSDKRARKYFENMPYGDDAKSSEVHGKANQQIITNMIEGVGSKYDEAMMVGDKAMAGNYSSAIKKISKDLDNLKDGKAINTTSKNLGGGDTDKTNIVRPDAVMHPDDDSTYNKYTTKNRIGTFVSGTLFHDLNLRGSNNYSIIGNGNTDIQLKGNINEATLDGGTF